MNSKTKSRQNLYSKVWVKIEGRGGIPWEIIRIGPKGTKVPDWDVYRIVDTFIMLIISGANSDDA